MIVLGNVPVIEIGDAKIKNDGQNKAEVENGKISPKIRSLCMILDPCFNTQNINGFNRQVHK